MGIFHSIKKSRRVSSDIDEKIEYLNKELEKTGLREAMTTSGMYFGSQEIPGIPAENADVPDSTGVLGSDFTPPIGGNGNPNDPSNYPDAYDTAWMYNSNDVDGETNRPIVATLDPSLIAAFNAANPGSSQFPAGGAGIVFGSSGFGTGVGYAKAGHFYQVLNPGLFGNGSTKLVPPGSPFSAPWFGLFGLYFPATPELAEIVMAMTGAYTDAGGYNPQGALQILLWRNHNRFHDGPFNEWTGKKYTDSETGQNYILQTFYLHQKGNQYEKTPAVPPTSIVIQRNDLGDPNFLPINIDLGEISPEGFNYLSGRADKDLALFGFGRKPRPVYYGGQAGEDLRNLKKDIDLFNKMSPLGGGPGGTMKLSHVPEGDLLSEAVKLGHFEPEQLNVNIEDLRKGIMPEFPKDPPPEMVNGYSSKSRLAPKELERSSFIKITKKDLAKNHRLKDSEIKDFMDQINSINEFIKKHPEELIYAQTRYPKSDPRLAQLNWEMDQKLNASKEYMDKHYPENQKLFKKIQKSISKNIELTDPKSFKGVKVPKFKGVDLTDFKRRKEVVARHYKKAVKTKKLFSRKKT